MHRRRFCALLAAGTVAGCGAFPDGPDPAVIEHVRGDVAVVQSSRVFDIESDDEHVRVVLANDGADARVDVALFWVPRVGLDFEGRTPAALREEGHEPVARRRVSLARGERRVLTFDVAMPEDVAGYYVYKNNRTFGGVVENRGDAGPVAVRLVDTTDVDDQRVLAARTIRLAAGERRTVTFDVGERYEMFRIDAFPAATRSGTTGPAPARSGSDYPARSRRRRWPRSRARRRR